MTDQLIIDRTNDTLRGLVLELAPDADQSAVDAVVDDLTHTVAAYIASLDRDDEIADLLATLEARGGRDVDLAEQIDDLRLGRIVHAMIPIRLADEDSEPDTGAAIGHAFLDALPEEWWDASIDGFHICNSKTTPSTWRII